MTSESIFYTNKKINNNVVQFKIIKSSNVEIKIIIVLKLMELK